MQIELDGQYRALREEAGAVERPRGLLEVRGSQAQEYVQGQVTNDVLALDEGEGCYAALLDRKGHMRGDLRVLRRGDDLLLDMEPEGLEAIRGHLSTYLVGYDARVEDLTPDLGLISVIGPASATATGVEGLRPEYAHREVEIGGTRCRAIATDLGLDLVCPAAEISSVQEALASAGAAPVSEEAAEILRVESGRPRFGREMTTRTIPAEAGINERAVSFSKGCYIGQETVARLHYRGKPNRHLRGLRLSAPTAPGAALALSERQVGEIGTSCVSPALGPIGLAVIRREAEPGAVLQVGEEDGGEAEVVELPFR